MALTKRLLLALGIFAAWLPQQSAAQVNPTLRALAGGVETGEEEGKASRARILEFSGNVHVVGPTADVSLEFLLGTTSGSPDEIRLSLALPPDAVITGYALDVGGTLIPGQLLEQNKARNVYEDQIRTRVDPGLGEVTADNRFSTRVFPVTAHAPRRIRVQFSTPLDPEKGLQLPLESEVGIGKADFAVEIEGAASAPSIRFGNREIALRAVGSGWAGEWQGSGAALRGGLQVSATATANRLQVATHANGERFFILADSGGPSDAAMARGGRLRIYWDRSLSHGDDRTDLEAEVLAQLVAASAPSGIDLVTFASDAPQVSRIAGGAQLKAALEGVTYRGGTSLAGLDALDLPDAAQCVIVFDGKVTIDQAAEFAPDCRLSALSAAEDADGARLGRIAGRTQGRYFRLQDGTVAETAAAIARPGLSVTSLRDAGGRTVPFRSLPAADGSWLLVGPMPDGDRLDLRASAASGERLSRTYVAAGGRFEANAPAALWAAQEMVELVDDPVRHEEMVAFARKYRVASTAMSFLVLERADQYVEAGLAPPMGFSKQWFEGHDALKQQHDRQVETARTNRFAFVLGGWEARKAWWAKPFTPRARPKDGDRFLRSVAAAEEAAPADEAAPAEEVGFAAAAPPPPAPPPPPSSRNRAAQGERDDAPIVVTGSFRQAASFDSPTPVTTVDAELLEQRSESEIRQNLARLPQFEPAQESQSAVAGGRPRAIALDVANLLGDRPFLAALDQAAPGNRMAVLAEQERTFGKAPAFYLETSEWFRLKGDLATASLLLLSALELPNANDETRQIVAFRLERDRAFDRAVDLAERIAAGAEFRPQPKRSLALALAARGLSEANGRADLERAFRLLTEVALEPAIGDFDGIEIISLAEANTLIPAIEAAGGRWSLDKRLVGMLDTDMRVVIEWTADDADIDLWVDEPNGERVFYGAKLSSSGGAISNDMTNGYGPEEYVIRRAPRGDYEIRINGYDADRLNPNGGGRVLARLTRNFGRRDAEAVMVDAELAFQQGRNRDEEGRSRLVGTLDVE